MKLYMIVAFFVFLSNYSGFVNTSILFLTTDYTHALLSFYKSSSACCSATVCLNP